jgi:hypothetical protein
MKRLLLVAASVMAPFGFAMADSASDAKGDGAKKGVEAAGPTFPDWDQRKAGETLDTSGSKAADDAKQ